VADESPAAGARRLECAALLAGRRPAGSLPV
jgi:hypothetical protein